MFKHHHYDYVRQGTITSTTAYDRNVYSVRKRTRGNLHSVRLRTTLKLQPHASVQQGTFISTIVYDREPSSVHLRTTRKLHQYACVRQRTFTSTSAYDKEPPLVRLRTTRNPLHTINHAWTLSRRTVHKATK